MANKALVTRRRSPGALADLIMRLSIVIARNTPGEASRLGQNVPRR